MELLSTIKEAGYRATLVTVEVGSCGLPNILGFEKLKHELKLTSAQTSDFMVEAAKRQSLDLSVSGVAETELDVIYLFFGPVYHNLLISLFVAWNQVIVQCFCRAL